MQLDYQGRAPLDSAATPGTLLTVGDTSVAKTTSETSSRISGGRDAITPFRQASRPFGFQMYDCKNSRRFNLNTPVLTISAECRTSVVKTIRASEIYKTPKSDITIIVYPKGAGQFFGITYGLFISAKATSGWQYSLEPFRAVEETALVFEFCREGNLEGVKALFKRNEASPWDRDPKGQTPLLVRVLLITRRINPVF
jgi:hypothetical protein